MVQLLAQFVFVDLVGEPHGLGAVDQREGRVHIRIELPDHLQHQELVEIRIEQAAHDRVELPGMIVDAPGDIGLGHLRNCSSCSAARSVIRAKIAATL
ncbi:hypothetical protein D3C87_1570470 [compost metagenome]